MTEILLAALLVIVGVAWAELRDWLPTFARRIVGAAVRALPIESRSRMSEELTAEVVAVPGKVSPFIFACSVWWGFWKLHLLARLDRFAAGYVLRLIDVTLALGALFFWAPVIGTAIVLTSVSCGRFGIRRTQCLGRHRKPFMMLSLQTKHVKSGKVTAVGRLVRRCHLEHLPAVLNILRGDMSIVGPLPANFINGQYDAHIARLRPGFAWHAFFSLESVEGFDESAVATIRIYFKALANDALRSVWR